MSTLVYRRFSKIAFEQCDVARFIPCFFISSINLTYHNYPRRRNKSTICGNHSLQISNKISLRYCTSCDQPSNDSNEQSIPISRRLLVLLSWISAKDKYVEKYRPIYFKHGFDILTVTLSPFDIFYPPKGSKRIASDLIEYLLSQSSRYTHIIFHGFSAGAYQFGEILIKLDEGLKNEKNSTLYKNLITKIKGTVFDSAGDVNAVSQGIARSLSTNKLLSKSIELLLNSYLVLCYPVSTKHYLHASKRFHNTFLRCPALLLFSNDDELGPAESNFRLAEQWKHLGLDVSIRCFNRSSHVLHLNKYPIEYKKEVDDFLAKLELSE